MNYILEKFYEAMLTFGERLDWIYMLLLIIISKLLEGLFPDHLYKIGNRKFRFPVKYRVPVIGLIMGIVSYLYNGFYDKQHALMYLQSMIAAMAVYSWLLDALIKKFGDLPFIGVLKDKMKLVKGEEPKK